MINTCVRASALLILSIAVTRAQESASISGQVVDASDAPIEGVTVAVKNSETGSVRSLTTDKEGLYSAPTLAVGKYEISAQKPGFASSLKTGISLVVGQHAEVNLSLAVGELKQLVTVEERVPVVAVTTEQTSGLVGEKQVKELPLNGRSYDGLMVLNPGIVNYTSQRAGGIGTSNSAIGNMFAASGRRPQESIFLLNGIEYTSASVINLTPGGASGQLIGVDAVREFNVVTDTYGAEYGKRPGAQVSILTSSGTNQFHGSVYEFLRNSALDARNFFDQGSVPPFERNEFGVALGGPIQRDKTFVFGNYEGFRQRLGLSNVTLVPDNNARLGYLPDQSGRLSYVGLGPGVSQLLSLWPVQNGPTLGGGIGIAYNNPIQRIREDFGTTRIDHVFSERDSLFGVYTVDDSADNTPTINPLSLIDESLRAQVLSLQETHVFSPRVLNTARFGFSRGNYFFTGTTPVDIPGWIEGAQVGTLVIGGSTASNAATQLSPAGTNVGSNTRAARNLFTYEDQVSITVGKHQIQTGAWIQRIQANDIFAQGQYGQAGFSSLLNFLKGTATNFTAVPSPTMMGWRTLQGAGFVQDTIKVASNFELKVGFRFESTNGWNEATGRASNYDFDRSGIIQTNPYIGTSALKVNNARFLPQPRVGFAWDPFRKGNTVIRAGFGMYNGLLDNLDYRLDQNAPFNTTLSLRNIPISSIHIVPGQPLPSSGLISPAGIEPNLKTPTVISYTFKIEQKISPDTSLAIGYAGSHGYKEILSVDANQPTPTICPASPCPANLASGTIYYPKGAPFVNPALANTISWFSGGNSSYNALQVDVNHRFSYGFQLRGVYTFSKSLDNGGTLNNSVGTNTPAFVMFPLNPKIDWGRSPFDATHIGAINGTYELPFGKGKRILGSSRGLTGGLVSGWSLSGLATLQSGFPFTPQLGFNPSNNGDTRNPVRPSLNPAFQGKVVLGDPSRYFDPNAFVIPVSGTYGNVGRDVLVGPGLGTVDVSLLKNTPIKERLNLQFRAEFFNALNRANFNTPNPVVFTSSSTQPTSTAGVINATATTSRQIQFGLKLLW
jgi:hypothetical protein